MARIFLFTSVIWYVLEIAQDSASWLHDYGANWCRFKGEVLVKPWHAI